MIVLIAVGGVFLLVIGFHVIKTVQRLSIERETNGILEENRRKADILGRRVKLLPKEDELDFSEELSEIKGIPCSAVMDEEDEEAEND